MNVDFRHPPRPLHNRGDSMKRGPVRSVGRRSLIGAPYGTTYLGGWLGGGVIYRVIQ
jgi:hypothetical protein